MRLYEDRRDAGQRLGELLSSLAADHPIVLALPRGGVPVASVIAEHLGAPLDVLVVRKLGVPWHPEVAMGAIAEDGVCVLDHQLIDRAGVHPSQLAAVERQEEGMLSERTESIRRRVPALNVVGATVIIVDDGIATGATAEAACEVARGRGAVSVIVAAPVGSREAISRLSGADRVICPWVPSDFGAVGAYYRDFSPVEDAEVLRMLIAARGRVAGSAGDTAHATNSTPGTRMVRP